MRQQRRCQNPIGIALIAGVELLAPSLIQAPAHGIPSADIVPISSRKPANRPASPSYPNFGPAHVNQSCRDGWSRSEGRAVHSTRWQKKAQKKAQMKAQMLRSAPVLPWLPGLPLPQGPHGGRGQNGTCHVRRSWRRPPMRVSEYWGPEHRRPEIRRPGSEMGVHFRGDSGSDSGTSWGWVCGSVSPVRIRATH